MVLLPLTQRGAAPRRQPLHRQELEVAEVVAWLLPVPPHDAGGVGVPGRCEVLGETDVERPVGTAGVLLAAARLGAGEHVKAVSQLWSDLSDHGRKSDHLDVFGRILVFYSKKKYSKCMFVCSALTWQEVDKF